MNKVMIFGLLSALVGALIPMVQGGDPTVYSVSFGLAIAGIAFLTKNNEGEVWSILGIIGAVVANFFAEHPTPEGITIKDLLGNYLLPLLFQFLMAKSKMVTTAVKK